MRLQGQYADEETGLAYNRWTSFEPEAAVFVSADPIRLDGGSHFYRLAPNAFGWIDPAGLINQSAVPPSVWARMQKLPSTSGVYAHESG